MPLGIFFDNLNVFIPLSLPKRAQAVQFVPLAEIMASAQRSALLGRGSN